MITQTNTSNALQPLSFEHIERLANYLAKSDFVPKGYKNKPGDIIIAIHMGLEVGLKPLQAPQNIMVINGHACLWGDAMLALVKAHHSCEYVDEQLDEKAMVATCNAKRKNQPVCTRTFSMEDAKLANLLGKQPWREYPKRMLKMRARSFALRDSFPDVLQGLACTEEVSDYNINNNAKKPNLEFKDLPATPSSIYVDKTSITQQQPQRISDNQLQHLRDLLQKHEVDVSGFYNHYGISSLDELNEEQYEQAIRIIQKRPQKVISVDEMTHQEQDVSDDKKAEDMLTPEELEEDQPAKPTRSAKDRLRDSLDSIGKTIAEKGEKE